MLPRRGTEGFDTEAGWEALLLPKDEVAAREAGDAALGWNTDAPRFVVKVALEDIREGAGIALIPEETDVSVSVKAVIFEVPKAAASLKISSDPDVSGVTCDVSKLKS